MKVFRCWASALVPARQPRPKNLTGVFLKDGADLPFDEPKSIYEALNAYSRGKAD
jgi:hypothetical protein